MVKNNPYIELLSDKLYYQGTELDNPSKAVIGPGVTAVIGANGSGKSTLGNILEKGWNFRTNRLSSNIEKPAVRKIEFSDIHSLAGASVEYYQQRYESLMNDEVPTVAEVFGEKISTERWQRFSRLFNLGLVESRKINFLSSGELRKTLIINALSEETDVLILDNPYIGLDAPSRALLNEAIAALRKDGITVVLLVANPDDVPDCIDSVVPISNMKIGEPVTSFSSVRELRRSLFYLFDFAVDVSSVPAPSGKDSTPVNVVVSMKACNVSYGSRKVISELDWEIRDCQRWALSGPNGSGKSTLLSLITADNPKAYSNDITLFDRQRGSGESIWEIKRRIGYISPEMTLYFNTAPNVLTIVAQGLNDTTGQFARLSDAQRALAAQWLNILHLEHLADRRFTTLSSGERQMVLLARTFIKQPRLLILDEPLHGLDYARAKAVRALINYFAARSDAYPGQYPMTLIFVSHYAWEMPECINFTKTLQKL